MHFTLTGITTHAQATEQASKAADDYFGHRRYDIEMEARPWTNLPSAPWNVEVTVRVWDLDE